MVPLERVNNNLLVIKFQVIFKSMLGLAQVLFAEKFSKKSSSFRLEWPLLDHLLSVGILYYADYALAQQLLERYGHKHEGVAAFICHLCMCARQGHLCVHISGRIQPSIENIWKANEAGLTEELSQEAIQRLEALIWQGINVLPDNLCSVIRFKEIPQTPLCKWEQNYYLQRYFVLETHFLEQFHRLFSQAPKIKVDHTGLSAFVSGLLSEKKLLPEQAQAIVQASSHALMVITGGPGTGKTYTAGVLLRALWDNMQPDQKAHCKIDLAAPTGKAAANLQASIQKALNDYPNFPAVHAKTLHSLLKKRRQSSQFNPPLNSDILLVDESSMIDLNLMGSLLNALKPGSRLILLGDAQQLPSVEAGSLFADLVAYLKKEGGSNLAELKTSLRTEIKGILNLAETVKNGDFTSASLLLHHKGVQEGIKFTSLKLPWQPKDVYRKLADEVFPQFLSLFQNEEEPSALLRKFSSYRLLSPLRQGPFGSEAINSFFFRHSLKKAQDYLTVPIMITENCPQLNLYNGEVGLLIKSSTNDSKNYALFPSRLEAEKVLKLPALLLPKYEYAYCISIHKSQGSEFDKVVLLLPSGSESFGKEALYTGITRARHSLEIWSDDLVLEAMIKRSNARRSSILERLQRQ